MCEMQQCIRTVGFVVACYFSLLNSYTEYFFVMGGYRRAFQGFSSPKCF